MKNILLLLLLGLSSALWAQHNATIEVEDHNNGHLKQAIFLLSEADGISVLSRKDAYVSFSYNSEVDKLAAMAMLQSNNINVLAAPDVQLDFPSLPKDPTQEQIATFVEKRKRWATDNPEQYKQFDLLQQQNPGKSEILTTEHKNPQTNTKPDPTSEGNTKNNNRANYNNPGGTITTCSGNFYDTGGPFGYYTNYEYIITTFCPDTPGECIQIDFSMLDIEPGWDFLDIYNGPDISSPYMGYFTGAGTATVFADASNSGGCLTFWFTSDDAYSHPGWEGAISCVPCQESTITDCVGGETVCSDATLSGNENGWGNVSDLNLSNYGCLETGENQSSWYLFSPATSGNIGFTLSPNTGVDYDFAIWGPYAEGSTSADICPPSGHPIRCSWSSDASTYWNTSSYDTGIGHPTYSPPQFASPYTTYSEDPLGDGWVSGLTVTAGEVYVLVIDNYTANSTPFQMDWDLQNGATLDCTVLPVELLSFTGEHQNGENILQWKTASEQNADHFELQRSDDGVDYQTLGIIPAQGNSSTVKNYHFIDKNPTRLHYYRLNQVDFNGQAKKHGPVAINLQGSGTTVLPVFPNPVLSDLLHIPLSLEFADEVTLKIISLTGQVLIEQTMELGVGNHEVDLNLETIASGMYHLHITDNMQRGIYAGKVVK